MAASSPLHLLAYGTLLGTQLYNTFVSSVVAFQVLPRAQFAQFQTAQFPLYFALQSVLPALLWASAPDPALSTRAVNAANSSSARFRTLVGSVISGGGGNSARTGVLPPANHGYLAFAASPPVLIATIALAGLANAIFLGPLTTRTMRSRKHQETRDGKRSFDPPPHSKEMQALNRRFATLHGLSSLVNLVAVGATVAYAFQIGG